MKHWKNVVTALFYATFVSIFWPNICVNASELNEEINSYTFWTDNISEDFLEEILINENSEHLDDGNELETAATITLLDNGIGEIVIHQDTEYSEEMLSEQGLYPNYIYEIDSEFDTGYSLEAFEQWHLQYLQVPKAWKLSTGEGIKVAVIDSGIDSSINVWGDRLLITKTVIPSEAYGSGGYFLAYQGPEDRLGHGTHVAAIIGASDDVNGIYGIAKNCTLMSYKALEKNNSSATGKTSWIANAVIQAKDDGAQVINLSLGGSYTKDEFLAQAIKKVTDEGCCVVCAAGNYSGTGYQGSIYYPASDENTIAVTALKKDNGGVAFDMSYSRYGPQATISAPGTDILSYWLDEPTRKKGTSMATPMVSGTIALMKAINQSLSSAEILDILSDTAIDLGDVGRDDYYGYGSLNLLESVKKARALNDKNKPAKPEPTPKEKPVVSEESGYVETPADSNIYQLEEPETELIYEVEAVKIEQVVKSVVVVADDNVTQPDSQSDVTGMEGTDVVSQNVVSDVKQNEDENDDESTSLVNDANSRQGSGEVKEITVNKDESRKMPLTGIVVMMAAIVIFIIFFILKRKRNRTSQL